MLAAALHAGVDHVAVGGIEGEHALSRGVVDRDGGLVAALVRHERQHIGGVELRRNNAVFRLGTQIAHKAPFPEDIERRAADVVDRGGAAAEGDGGRVELDLLRVDLAAVVGEHAHARGGNDQQAVAEEGEAVRAVVVVIIGVLARGVGLIVAQRAAETVEIRQVQIRRGEHRSQHDREHRHQHQNTVERAAARRRGAIRAQILARELILVSH